MAYDGLRAFVETLEREGRERGVGPELVRVHREVDPYLEIAEIADRTMKAGGPALLFENVKGSRFPLLINAYGSRRRMSRALGVDDLEEHARTIEQLVHTRAPKSARELAEMAGKLPALASAVPRRVSSAACQEVVQLGEDVDLMTLPVMTCWPDDGGPFFTLPNVITKDPDTGARNIGMYRMQRIDRRTTAMHWQIHKTGARHFRRAKELGKRLEVAVAFGGDPALTYAATAPLPDGIDEWMFAGFLRGKPVEHVRCKTVDLEVPACADFVLEGYVDPSEDLFAEGPVRRSHGLLHAGRRVPALPRHGGHASQERDLSRDAGGPAADGGRLARQGHRAPLPAAPAHDLPGGRRHEPPGGGRVPQPRAPLDQEAVPLPRVAHRARAVGLRADVLLEGDLRARRRRRRPEHRRGRLAPAREPRPQARHLHGRRSGRPARPRRESGALRREDGDRRHAQVGARRATSASGRRSRGRARA